MNDAALVKIDTEELARRAYVTHPALQKEFSTVETFLAYWKALCEGRVRIL